MAFLQQPLVHDPYYDDHDDHADMFVPLALPCDDTAAVLLVVQASSFLGVPALVLVPLLVSSLVSA